MLKVTLIIIAAAVMLFGVPSNTLAQTSKGTIVGTVLDPNGAAVPGATIKLTNIATGVSREATTVSEGTFRFEAVDPGNYKIEVTAGGFKAATLQNVTSAGGQTSDYPVTLEVGNPNEVVQVTSETVILQTQDGTRVNTLDAQQITELPVAGLNPVNLVFTLPGVTNPGSKAGGFVQGTEFNVNGLRARNNNQLIDGLDNNDNSIAGQNYQPVLRDGYSEVTVLQSDYSAEYGRAGGAVVNVISKGGTNDFHGSAYDVIFNSALNSRTPGQRSRDDKKPVLTENTFGGSLGGPILKNKLFFFGTFQPDLTRSTTSAQGVVPTAAGFQTLRALFPAGRSANLDAYLATVGNVRGNSQTFTVPLGGGRPDVEFGTASTSSPQPVNDYQGLFRVDWTPNSKDSYGFRYLFDHQLFANQFPSIFSGYEIDVPSLTQNFYANYTRTISASTTNEFRFGFFRTNVVFGPRNQALLTAGPQVGFASSGIDSFNLNGVFPQGRIFNNYQFQDTISHTIGNHTLRVGVDFLKQYAKEFVPFGDRGALTFSADDTGEFSDFANFVDQFSGVEGGFGNKVFGSPIIHPKPFYQFYFVNDTWRVKPNLTVNLGLRYENYGTPYNAVPFPAFDFNTPFTQRVEQKPDNNNFAPRVSFAYQPDFFKKLFGENRTVLRGGFAVNYDFFFTNILENTASGPPNANAVAIFGSDVGGRGFANATITGSLPSQFTGAPDPQGGINSIVPNLRNPESYVWNLGIQRELPWHLISDIAYVGSRGLHQFLNVDFNPRIGELTGRNGAPRVRPDFGSVILRTNSGDSNYHSLQARLERGFNNGLFFRTAYTFSKTIDVGNSEVFVTTGGNTFRQSDPLNLHGGLRTDRSLASYDVPHRLVATVLYDLPSPFKSGFGKSVFGGFQLSGIYRIQSGNVDTPFAGGIDLNRDGSSQNDRPSISNPNAPATSVAIAAGFFGLTSPTGYVDANGDPIALANARYVVDRNIRTGVAGRNTLRAPKVSSLDFSLQRSLNVPLTHTERDRFEIRVEFFNVLNQPQFSFQNANDANVLNPFFNRPRLNEGGPGANSQYLRTGRIQLRYVF
ncbi:MAG TPA: carboxypeptidase regulatory-like domain-containing protein [Pyrinomonadaceae bacterium]|jgi:outer membrane receptor protein involved in Fe transport|nr:carboxypeptidase regulatory-like domain-containing protein [Pyrinomonadaceae bacterium]